MGVRFLFWFAALLTAITGAACYSMADGNPTAINGVIGCGISAAVMWTAFLAGVRS